MATKKSSRKKKKFKLLKKIARCIYILISKIYNVVDKLIVTPLAKLMLKTMGLFKNFNKVMDRLLNIKGVLLILSLAIAVLTFINYENATERLRNNSADILYNQKVTALYNEEAYVVKGLPETVDITLIGRRADLYLAKQYPEEEVEVDLSGLKPGTHKVKLKHDGSVASVEYKIDPSTVTVTIYEKMSESHKVSTEILYENKLDSKYTISDVNLNKEEVYVKGDSKTLAKISVVKALIDIRKIIETEDSEQTEEKINVGTKTIKDIPLVAYDANGNKLNVEIVPRQLEATLKIDSPSKEVPLKVIPTGDVVFGKAIDEIKLSKSTATIYGNKATLDKITYVPIDINVDGLDKTTEFDINVSLPSGVRDISTKTVVVEVTLGNVKEKQIDNVGITTKNLGAGLTAQAASQQDSSIAVIIKGTSNNLKDITSENITAYVDLQGLGKGTHKVDVKVTGEDLKLSYIPKTETVTITIK